MALPAQIVIILIQSCVQIHLTLWHCSQVACCHRALHIQYKIQYKQLETANDLTAFIQFFYVCQATDGSPHFSVAKKDTWCCHLSCGINLRKHKDIFLILDHLSTSMVLVWLQLIYFLMENMDLFISSSPHFGSWCFDIVRSHSIIIVPLIWQYNLIRWHIA